MRSPIMYESGTHDDLVTAIEGALTKGTRIRVTYPDGYSVSGYVGWSVGPQKAMLLVYNRRCLGGGTVDTSKIVKVETTKGKQVLWDKV